MGISIFSFIVLVNVCSEKPMPKPKATTRWETFAKTRGIQNKKKSRKEWDDQNQEYRPRFGYKRAKDESSDWLIEVPKSAGLPFTILTLPPPFLVLQANCSLVWWWSDPMEDQYEKKVTEKKERVAKNQKNQQKNLERAEKISKVNGGGKILKEQKKKELSAALRTSKTATASLGKFDRKLKHEPKMKSLGKKNKFDPVVLGTDVEKTKSLGVLDKVTKTREKGKLINANRAANKLQVENEGKARDRKQKFKK